MGTTMNPQKNTSKHPPGLYLLFFTEMWERFSYYGMRGILVLYLTKEIVSGGLGMNATIAMSIYGFYTGAVYITPLIGGWLSDMYLGKRLAITIGGITMAIGNFVMFLGDAQWSMYTGLLLLIIGNGFFKPNISSLVGDLYEEKDPKRDAAFTIFYMGINLGAFFAPLIIAMVTDKIMGGMQGDVFVYGYKYGFLISSIGMVIGQVLFNILGNKYLGDLGKKPNGREVIGDVAAKNKPLTKVEKQRTAAILILACFVVFFWAGFEQAGSSLTLYTDKFVDRTIFGFEIPTPWFQSVNPLFIILLAPLVSILWVKLGNSKRGDFSSPFKMGIGMILLGLGYMILLVAVLGTGSNEAEIVSKAHIIFIVLTYFFHTLGELFLSPVGLSTVSRIAPVKLASLLMGVWLASSGVANILAGQLASVTQSLGYFEVFAVIGAMAIVLGLILLAFSKKITKMMHVD
ncbi:peptide MFS transporter [Bacillus massiliigorillae]|uniref:peptide MFS transporter n=1 Tax=Bacillus massiliigorillae TaxID=1243664 RepID=UPI00039E19B5|nr:peptide MFS transporter [Bacillus massiliigorillae]